MALVVLAADKGSPGVTTTTLALAAVWPRTALVVECDPAGGDLVYRLPEADGGPLDPNLGLLSLAAAARRSLDPEQVWQHAQTLAGGLDVVVGIARAEQSAGLAGLWSPLGRAFGLLPQADAFADCGRIGSDSPTLELLPHAALVLLVARTQPEQVAHVRDRIAALAGLSQLGGGGLPPVGVLLVVEPKRRRPAVEQLHELLQASGLTADLVVPVAHDPAGADLLSGRRRGRPDKSLLVQSVREVARAVEQRLGTPYAERR
jgi:hypothetical protein